LGTVSAQNISLDTFVNYGAVGSSSLQWYDEYTTPYQKDNSIFIVDRFKGDSMLYNLVRFETKTNTFNHEELILDSNVSITDGEKYNSRITFLENEKFAVLVTWGKVYVFKRELEVLVLYKTINIGKNSGDEKVEFVSGDLILLDKRQPKPGINGGIHFLSLDLKKGKIKRQQFMDDMGSMFYYFDSNYDYASVTENRVILYDAMHDILYSLALNKSELTTLLDAKQNYSFTSSDYSDILLKYYGTITLLDSVQSIAANKTRIRKFCTLGNSVLCIKEFHKKDSVYLDAFILDINGVEKSIICSQENLRIITQGKLIVCSNKLLCFTAFGNLNLLDPKLTEEKLFSSLYKDKPIIGVYVFTID